MLYGAQWRQKCIAIVTGTTCTHSLELGHPEHARIDYIVGDVYQFAVSVLTGHSE
jgi:hypothetical protein